MISDKDCHTLKLLAQHHREIADRARAKIDMVNERKSKTRNRVKMLMHSNYASTLERVVVNNQAPQAALDSLAVLRSFLEGECRKFAANTIVSRKQKVDA